MALKNKPRKKHPKGGLNPIPAKPEKGWMCVGFDISLSSIAAAAMAWDGITQRLKGPAFAYYGFEKTEDYFERLKISVSPHDFIFNLQRDLNVILPKEDVWIAQEEPFPAHGSFMQRGISSTLKQQAELSGAFLGGLVKWGYTNIFQIGNHQWRQLVARDLTEDGEEVTIHHSKWRSQKLAEQFHCRPKDSGKFRVQQWAFQCFEPYAQVEMPDYPPLIHTTKEGKKPRPENSRALAFQPDDRYDALAICAWMVEERARLFPTLAHLTQG